MTSLIRAIDHIALIINVSIKKNNCYLISALVERSHPKIRTFYLPCGECTIILEDVALQLWLPVDRVVITSSSKVTDVVSLCSLNDH